MNKKAFIIQTIGMMLFYIFGWLIVILLKGKETFQDSTIIRDIINEYKSATETYKEFYDNDFDVDKINKAREDKFLKEIK